MSRDARVDAYIEKAPPFAQPVLAHLREVAHRALPGTSETIKWGMPHFTLQGKNIAGMAAFKAHCAFTIHGDGRQGDDSRQQAGRGESGMGQFGRIASLADVPSEAELTAKLHAARDRVLQEGTATRRPATRQPKPEIAMPDDLAAALAQAPAAQACLAGFAPSHRREYLEWITEAKSDATRNKRIAQAVEWLAEGKKRNWKYEAR